MERIKVAIARHGNIWTLQTNSEMNALYEPLHAEQKQQFAQMVKVDKGLKYGLHERHRLDVYRPVETTIDSALPMVVFFHGGAFSFSLFYIIITH